MFVNRPLHSTTTSMLENYISKRNMPNLKLKDISLWSHAFGANYSLMTTTPQDSDAIIMTIHGIEFTHINDENNKMTFVGLFWIDENYRGRDIMYHFTKSVNKDFPHKSFTGIMKPIAVRCFQMITGSFTECFKSYESTYSRNEILLDIGKPDGIVIKNLSDIPADLLTAYDQTIFPYNRSKYITNFLEQNNCYSRVALNSSGEIIGYGNIVYFESTRTAQIQPLYAENSEIARAILTEILTKESIDFEMISFRSNDENNESYEWIKPMLENGVELRRNYQASFGYSENAPKGLDFSRVFAGASTMVCPI